jgi:hypothetical protein
LQPLHELNLDHLERMTDNVGLLQHATHSAPNTEHGYCTDDNARALIFTTVALERTPGDARLELLAGRYFRFIEAAFQPNRGTFVNLLGYDGKWKRDAGPGDACGRALWALGTLVGRGSAGPQRSAAKAIFESAMPLIEGLTDLRPAACAILGLTAYLDRERSKEAVALLELTALRLTDQLERNGVPLWPWPEPFLTYENARIPQAMIAGGRVMVDESVIWHGLRSLEWLLHVQTEDGMLVPIGNRGWFKKGGQRARFDQQPIEAEATVAACCEAFSHTADPRWLKGLATSYSWFTGHNLAGDSVYDPETGGCRDGIGPDGLNQNQGAESTLAWLCASLNFSDLAPRQDRAQLAGLSR